MGINRTLTGEEIDIISADLIKKIYLFCQDINRVEGFNIEGGCIVADKDITRVINRICDHCITIQDFDDVIENTRKNLSLDRLTYTAGKKIFLNLFYDDLARLEKRNAKNESDLREELVNIKFSIKNIDERIKEIEQGDFPTFLLDIPLEVGTFDNKKRSVLDVSLSMKNALKEYEERVKDVISKMSEDDVKNYRIKAINELLSKKQILLDEYEGFANNLLQSNSITLKLGLKDKEQDVLIGYQNNKNELEYGG